MNWFKSKHHIWRDKQNAEYLAMSQLTFDNRMTSIKNIANKHMKSAQYGRHFPVREDVLVPWEDLLRIWNIADLAKSETVVK